MTVGAALPSTASLLRSLRRYGVWSPNLYALDGYCTLTDLWGIALLNSDVV